MLEPAGLPGLNPGKSEFLLIGLKLQRENIFEKNPIRLILDQDTDPSASDKNFGISEDT